MWIATLETGARRIGAVFALVTLGSIFRGILRANRRQRGRTSGAGNLILRPAIYLFIAVPYAGLAIRLWRPFIVHLSLPARVMATLVGSIFYGAGIAMMLWGQTTLGEMFNVSSGFGVQLFKKHRLITNGAYRYVRHPMYLGLLLATFGSLCLYRTWTTVFLLSNAIFVLIFRGRREEQVLATEFGNEWRTYARRVPYVIPRINFPKSS